MALPAPLLIGGNEFLWIIVISVILLFGSKKLPEVARGLGRAMTEFQRGRTEIERELMRATEVTRQNPPVTPATPPPRLPTAGPEHERLIRAAESLGIDPSGKTIDELKAALRHELDLGANPSQ